MKVPIIYNFFSFTSTRRKYPIYKRELYIIVEFAKKYDYLYKYPYHIATVHTNYKPLIYFLALDSHEDIYNHWANQLRRLNLEIKYIPDHRNKVADILSRTLFDSDYSETSQITKVYNRLTQQGSKWI